MPSRTRCSLGPSSKYWRSTTSLPYTILMMKLLVGRARVQVIRTMTIIQATIPAMVLFTHGPEFITLCLV
jgi:hypothetical protein